VKLFEKLSGTLCSRGFTIKEFKVPQSAEYRLRKIKKAKGHKLGGVKLFVTLDVKLLRLCVTFASLR